MNLLSRFLLVLLSLPLLGYSQTAPVTIFSAQSLRGAGATANKSYPFTINAPNPAATYKLTLLNGDGQAHVVQTCTGNVIQKLVCNLTNLVQTAYIALFRINSATISINGKVIVLASEFGTNTASLTKTITLLPSNQLQLTLKGPITASVQMKIELIFAPAKPPVLSNISVPPAVSYIKTLPYSSVVSFDSDTELSSARFGTTMMLLTADKRHASISITDQVDGIKAYAIEATSLGNLKTTVNVSYKLVLDQKAPGIQLGPQPLLTSMSALVVPITVIDSSPTTTEIYLNDSLAFSTGAQSFVYNLNMPKDGLYVLRVSSTDSAGNSFTQTLQTTKDTTPLLISVTSPSNGTTIRPGKFEVRLSANRSLVSATLNGVVVPLSSDGKSGVLQLEYLAEGSYQVTIQGTDILGFTSSSSLTIKFQNDQLAVWKYQECPLNE